MFRTPQILELARWMYEWHPAGQAGMAPGGNFMHRWGDRKDLVTVYPEIVQRFLGDSSPARSACTRAPMRDFPPAPLRTWKRGGFPGDSSPPL